MVCKSPIADTVRAEYQPLIAEHQDHSKAFGHGMWQGCFRRYWMATQVQPLEGKSVLDAGCAYGWLAPFVVGAGATSYTGVDPVDTFIDKAAERWSELGDRVVMRFLHAEILELAKLSKQKYDVVFALGLGGLELPSWFFGEAMKSCWSMCRESLVFSLPRHSLEDPNALVSMASSLTERFVVRRDYWGPDEMIWLYR